MTFAWFRPLSRECWKLAPDWRDFHRFMSTQALGLGTIALTVAISLNAPREWLIAGLIATAALTLAGSLIDQPEVSSDEHDDDTA